MRTFAAEKTPQCTFTSIRPRNTCGTSRNACPNSSTGKARYCTRDATRSKPSRRRANGWSSNSSSARTCCGPSSTPSSAGARPAARTNTPCGSGRWASIRPNPSHGANTAAWSEYRRRGLLCDSYYVSRRSDYTPLSQTTARFPAAGTLPVLEAFARFTVQLHEKGI